MSSEQSKSQFYIHIVLLVLLLLLCALSLVLFIFCDVDTVCAFTTECLDLIDYSYYLVYLYAAERRTVYIRIYLPAAAYQVVCCYTAVAGAAAACCSCSSSCAGWQKMFQWFTASDSSVVFSSNTFFFIYPMATLSNFHRRFLTHNTYHTSSVTQECAEPRRALAHWQVWGSIALLILEVYHRIHINNFAAVLTNRLLCLYATWDNLAGPKPAPHMKCFVVRSDELLNSKLGRSATGAERPIQIRSYHVSRRFSRCFVNGGINPEHPLKMWIWRQRNHQLHAVLPMKLRCQWLTRAIFTALVARHVKRRRSLVIFRLRVLQTKRVWGK